MQIDAAYDEFRPLTCSVAYRMLGGVSEAENVVQEAFLRFHRSAGARREQVDKNGDTVADVHAMLRARRDTDL